MKYRAYIYPVSNRLKSGINNPYIDNFMHSTEDEIVYLNKKSPSDTGVFNLLKYIHNTDLIFFNWAENLPEKTGGLLQSLFLLLLLRIRKLLGIRIIWTLHNKISHSQQHIFMKKLLFNSLLKRSDLIITHSSEGISFAESIVPGITPRIFYFPHPVSIVNGWENHTKVNYDILIWGTLAPYKGIDNFLEFLQGKNALDRFRILIAGKSVSPDFFQKINKYAAENIRIENQFIDPEKLSSLIHQSKVVLFTYSGGSVLSSGALMDSISHRARVIGPSVGAFAEMGRLGIIKTYRDFNELLEILDQAGSLETGFSADKVNKFIHSHTWSDFARAFLHKLPQVNEISEKNIETPLKKAAS